MGSEAASVGLTALSPVGGAILGASQARKAGKRARREARAHEESLAESRAQTAKSQQELSQKVAREQRRVAVEQARTNRARLRGGVFGEREQSARTVTTTLG